MSAPVIPENYWTGEECIKNRIPWMVPGAVIDLDKYLRPFDTVIEFGSGGSTLFFADRCKKVVTFELDHEFAHKFSPIVSQLENVDYHIVTSVCQARGIMLSQYYDRKFNVINVDWTDDRDFMKPFLPKFLCGRFMIVLDNYAAPYAVTGPVTNTITVPLFQHHHNRDYISGLDIMAYSKIYDDQHWWGQGTKIYSSFFMG